MPTEPLRLPPPRTRHPGQPVNLETVRRLSADAMGELMVPPGLPELTASETARWQAYSRARVLCDWTAHDVFVLYELVKMESRLIRVTDDFDAGDLYQIDRHGNDIAHPAAKLVTSFSRVVREMRSGLGLAHSAHVTTALLREGQARSAAERLTTTIEADHGDGLLAAPVQQAAE